ncbi:MAG: sugar ABC transporter permease [Spiroplasma sp.]|nr:sugar ABC transporter permease [Mycoplasmatales bacterium]
MKNLVFYISIILPGVGHAILKQKKQAIGFLALGFIELVTIVKILILPLQLVRVVNLDGTVTIGEVPWTSGEILWNQDSFVILISAVFAIILIILFLVINYVIARDARNTYRTQQSGERLLSYKEKYQAVAGDIIPHSITAPVYALLFLFLFVPAMVSILIAFTNYATPILPPAYLIEWVGFSNFQDLLSDDILSTLFKETFLWTMIWTFTSATLAITVGIGLAVIVNNKKIKGKKIFRIVFLLPWAVPAFLTILIFQIFFSQIGTMNTVVMPFLNGAEYSVETAIPFLMDPVLAKITIIMIQTWLGFPFVFILTTGILQAIPEDLYEASNMDGGSAWSNFWDITFPMILLSAAPMLITQYSFAFNNVTIIYLLGDAVLKDVGTMYGPIETLASLGYRLTLDSNYATAAAMTLITSVIVSTFVLISWIKAGAFKNEEVM